MATLFKKNHPKSRPLLVKIEGRWVCLTTAFTHPENVLAAESWCSEMNSPVRSLMKRLAKINTAPRKTS